MEFNLRFCRAKAYISSKTEVAEKEFLFSSGPARDLLSSDIGAVGKRFSSVCGRSLKKNQDWKRFE